MSLAVPYQLMDGYSVSRRLGPFSLRGIAWVVLASWLFSLVICSIDALELGDTPAHQSGSSVLAQADNHANHDGGTQDDACCSLLKNLSAFSHANNIQIPLHSPVYVLLPYIIALHAVLFIPTKVRFFGPDPPGKPNHVLIANSLWPNAPPR